MVKITVLVNATIKCRPSSALNSATANDIKRSFIAMKIINSTNGIIIEMLQGARTIIWNLHKKDIALFDCTALSFRLFYTW